MTEAEYRPAAPYSRTDGRNNLSQGPGRLAISILAAGLMLATLLFGVTPASAATRGETLLANEMFGQLNDERAARGLPAFQRDTSMDGATRRWSEKLEGNGSLSHSSDGRAEIVAYGWNTGQITDAWMRSAGHRNLITDRNLVPASISVSCDRDGRMWAVVQFRQVDPYRAVPSSSPTSPIATPSTAGGTCATPPADLDPAMVNSIKRLYRAYYLRDADGGGLDFWKNQASAGMNLWQISDHFAAAVEFDQRYGSLNNRQFVDLVYRNVMGRSPDAGGQRYWLDRLSRGLTRGELMTYFSDSPEYRARTGLN